MANDNTVIPPRRIRVTFSKYGELPNLKLGDHIDMTINSITTGYVITKLIGKYNEVIIILDPDINEN